MKSYEEGAEAEGDPSSLGKFSGVYGSHPFASEISKKSVNLSKKGLKLKIFLNFPMLLTISICVENDLKLIPFAKLVAKGVSKKKVICGLYSSLLTSI